MSRSTSTAGDTETVLPKESGEDGSGPRLT